MTRAPFEANNSTGLIIYLSRDALNASYTELYDASLCVHVSLNVALGGGESPCPASISSVGGESHDRASGFQKRARRLVQIPLSAEANFAEKAHDIVAVLLERSRLFHRYRRRRPKALVEQTRNGREERRNKAGLISGTTSLARNSIGRVVRESAVD